MQLNITHNFPEVHRYLQAAQKQATFAAAVALNRTAEWAETDVRKEMRRQFDRPTPFFLRSLRVIRATKQKLAATVWFKDNTSIDSSSTLVLPHVFGGDRTFKPMEVRLRRAGILPNGWKVVPGQGADLDAYGNMSRGQISQVLNVLGTFTEAGYNKADARTVARLAKGSARKGVYGFTYWINRVGGVEGKHLPPGIYKRVQTAFGSSLKPVMIFVNRTTYRKRLDFFGIVERTAKARFGSEFERAYADAMRTARP